MEIPKGIPQKDSLPDLSETSSPQISRRAFLKRLGLTAARIIAASFIPEGLSTEAGVPANPLEWTDNLGRARKDKFRNDGFGTPPNNPDRGMGYVESWINDQQVDSYQPLETLHPETQAGPGIDLGIFGLQADGTTTKMYMLTFVGSATPDMLRLSIEVIQNYNNPRDYSNNGRVLVFEGLPQEYLHRTGFKVTSYDLVMIDGKKYLQVGWENKYVPSENGLYRAELDRNGNIISPFRQSSIAPVSRRDLLFLPTVRK